MIRSLLVALVAIACQPGHRYEPAPEPMHLAATGKYLVIAPWEPGGVVGDTIRMGANWIVDGRTVSCAPTWESLNPEVASIADGLLTVHRAGSTTIRATCGDLTVGTTGSFGPKKGGP